MQFNFIGFQNGIFHHSQLPCSCCSMQRCIIPFFCQLFCHFFSLGCFLPTSLVLSYLASLPTHQILLFYALIYQNLPFFLPQKSHINSSVFHSTTSQRRGSSQSLWNVIFINFLTLLSLKKNLDFCSSCVCQQKEKLG